MNVRNSSTKVVIILLITLLALTSCRVIGFNRVRGSGNVISETREVSDFHAIDLSGYGDLIVTQGDTESLIIEADDNLMEYLESDVVNGTLRLGYEGSFRLSLDPTERIQYILTVIDLDEVSISGSGTMITEELESEDLILDASGSGEFRIDDLNANSLSVTFSGSGEAEIAGTVTDQEIRISGSGNYAAEDLASETAEVNVSGSGELILWVTEQLDIQISGSGDVSYYGEPNISQDISGSGDINNLGDK